MPGLRLDALDADDLQILSAYCQDALLKPRDARFLPREKRFVVEVSRFVWEAAADRPRWRVFARKRSFERRLAVLDFARVSAVRSHGIGSDETQVLSLLAMQWAPDPAAPPGGTITLVLAGGGAISLAAECVEARLTDGDAAWSTERRPDHDQPVAS